MFKRTALICAASVGWMFFASAAQALTVKPFTDADFAAAQAAGKPVVIHFTATWCPSCKAQEKSLAALASDASLKNVTILSSDYDKTKDLQKKMNVKSQSTMVVFKGKTEVVRSSAAIDASDIKTLLAKAL